MTRAGSRQSIFILTAERQLDNRKATKVLTATNRVSLHRRLFAMNAMAKAIGPETPAPAMKLGNTPFQTSNTIPAIPPAVKPKLANIHSFTDGLDQDPFPEPPIELARQP